MRGKRRRFHLLGVGRASLYWEPAGERGANLALMGRMHELCLLVPVLRQPPDDAAPAVGGGGGRAAPGAPLMRLMGLKAVCPKPRASEPHPEHRVCPYLLCGVAVERPDWATLRAVVAKFSIAPLPQVPVGWQFTRTASTKPYLVGSALNTKNDSLLDYNCQHWATEQLAKR